MSDHSTAISQLAVPEPKAAHVRNQFEYAFGFTAVSARHILLALVCSAIGNIILGVVAYSSHATLQSFKPIIIRVDEIGKAEPVRYEKWDAKPPAAIKYAFADFVKTHYGRKRASVIDDISHSLYYVHESYGRQLLRDIKGPKGDRIAQFVQGLDDEVKVVPLAVNFSTWEPQPNGAPKGQAVVKYQKIYTGGGGHETKRELYWATIDFGFMRSIPADYLFHNPMGVQITNIREDRAFDED